MVKKYNLFLESNQYNIDYVLGIPSGEIIFTSEEINKKLIDNDAVYYKHLVKGEIVNCYCFDDKDRDKVINYIEEKIPYKLKIICEEYQSELKKIIGRNVTIGYLEVFGFSYFYAIIPDLLVNKKYYQTKKSDIDDVVKHMKDKHFNCYFLFNSRMVDGKIRYFK